MKNKTLYIVGAQTTFITEAIEIAEAAGFADIQCVDNLETMGNKEICGYPVVRLSSWKPGRNDVYISCVHTPVFRKKVIEDMEKMHVPAVSLIHPSAIVSRRAKISGSGTIIAAGVIIGSNTHIGDHVIINRGALIGHDIQVGDFATIESGTSLGAFSHIGTDSYIGMHASVIPKMHIGNQCVVGAGSVVLEDVPDNTFVAGNPATVKRTGISGFQGTGNKVK